jgi:hypothetical protein
MAAVKMDEDVEAGLVPPEFGKIEVLSRNFGDLLFKQATAKTPSGLADDGEYDSVDLPPFLKHVLISMVNSVLSREKTESLK